jgi:hypothetical protein
VIRGIIQGVNQSTAPRTVLRCNIGDAEIARRRRMAIVLSVAAVVLASALVALAVPHLARLLLFPVAAAAGVTWLQVTQRFCVAFGAAGLENFGPLGSEHRVADEQAAADRRRALQLSLEGALAGAVATLALVVLPL